MSVRIKNFSSFPFEKLSGKDVKKVLIESIEYLNEGWWLSAGTLLGLERDGDFIPHDTDIDVGMIGDDIPDLPNDRYRPIRFVIDDQGRRHQSAYIHKESKIIFDILHYHEYDENTYYTESEKGRLYRDKDMLEDIKVKEYIGLKLNVPKDVNKYLTIWYDDWKVPKVGGKTKWKK